MDIWQPNSLLLFLLFFIPGFISQRVYALLVADDPKDSQTVLLSAVAYSSVNYAICSPLLVAAAGLKPPVWAAAVLALAVLFVLPVIWPIVWFRLLRWEPIRRRTISQVKRPWDYIFGQNKPYWLIVHLTNGKRIAGVYGSKSFASSYPQKEQMYLEKAWELDADGKFKREVPDTDGVIIMSSDIEFIELLVH